MGVRSGRAQKNRMRLSRQVESREGTPSRSSRSDLGGEKQAGGNISNRGHTTKTVMTEPTV